MFIIIKATEGEGFVGIETSAIKGFFFEAEASQMILWMGESDSIVVPGDAAKPLAKFLADNLATHFYEIKGDSLDSIDRDKLSSQ